MDPSGLGDLGEGLGRVLRGGGRGERRRAVAEERHFADTHWSLIPSTGGGWQLTNTGTVPAADTRFTRRRRRRRSSTARRVGVLVFDVAGLAGTADRLRIDDEPSAEPHEIGELAPGSSVLISATPPWDWLEVDWTTPDGLTHWTKLVAP